MGSVPLCVGGGIATEFGSLPIGWAVAENASQPQNSVTQMVAPMTTHRLTVTFSTAQCLSLNSKPSATDQHRVAELAQHAVHGTAEHEMFHRPKTKSAHDQPIAI